MKWKKKWGHVSPSSKKKNTSSSVVNGGGSAFEGSHLLFFKWAPLSQGGNSGNEDGKSEINSPSDEPVTETTARQKNLPGGDSNTCREAETSVHQLLKLITTPSHERVYTKT
ncbi:uncharacterized protein LOC130502912 [Raphanus sativus]|uniref:Uncharacterized protein LOC130502912 n=1 Tax=Raphanus sativus TaxID=3726 RepID=A0A9W3CQB9_RAPSA|nr:uncharacterized protein LOC130502912 [Raphanus sativus]